MVLLGLEPGVAIWKAHSNPLSYGGTPYFDTYSWDFYLLIVNFKLGHRFIKGKYVAYSTQT